jgi:endonuclease YncB( thermonuclease family)
LNQELCDNYREIIPTQIEKDRYGRTVAEVYVQDRKNSAISLNLETVRAGYAWHYAQYFDSCPIQDELIMAEGMAKQEKARKFGTAILNYLGNGVCLISRVGRSHSCDAT